MTLDEFYAELKTIAPVFEWVNSGPGMARAFLPGRQEIFCPLTAVYYAREGRHVGVRDATAAAVQFGLSRQDAWTVEHAADNTPNALQHDQERLFAAIGLFV